MDEMRVVWEEWQTPDGTILIIADMVADEEWASSSDMERHCENYSLSSGQAVCDGLKRKNMTEPRIPFGGMAIFTFPLVSRTRLFMAIAVAKKQERKVALLRQERPRWIIGLARSILKSTTMNLILFVVDG